MSKRIKPKVNLKNNSSARSINNNKTALKPPDTGQNEQNIKESIIKTPEGSAVPEEQNLKSDTPEDKKNEDNIKRIEETTTKILEKEPAEKVEESVEKNKKDDTSLSSSRKLSKRLKVGPKLLSPRPTSTEKEISTVESSSTLSKESCEQKRTNSIVDEKVSIAATTDSENVSVGSKLQKRKKVMPNLKMPSKNETDKLLKTNDNCSTKKENITIKTNNESIETDNKVESSEIKNNTKGSDQARKTKHVHFQSNGDVTENNNAEVGDKLSQSTNTISPEKTKQQSEKISKPSPNSKPTPSILKKDHVYDNNYSSQSEGEATSTHTSLGKGKKVFKPNLGPRRRKRLSSFSAYSSCDDEDAGDAKSKQTVNEV